jgi:hypothetical protein
MAKCSQYVYGINELIHQAKRFPPISHDWVTMDFAGSGEGMFSVASPSVCDAIENILGKPLDYSTQEKVTTIVGPKSQSWNQAKGFARVHAELRIIIHFGLPPSPHSSAHVIGVSKRSCLACVLWIMSHNDLFTTQWMTSGSHGKAYPNWALPGDACAYQSRDRVDKEVMKQVYQRLLDQVKLLVPGERSVSGEYVSSGGEGSEFEERIKHALKQQTAELLARQFGV